MVDASPRATGWEQPWTRGRSSPRMLVRWRGRSLTASLLVRRSGSPGACGGWLRWAIGFAITVSFWGSQPVWAVLADQGRSTAWAVLPQLGTMLWLGTLLGLLPLLVLVFPTGRLLSPRWRPAAWALGLVLDLYLTARLLLPGPIELSLPVNPDNPLRDRVGRGAVAACPALGRGRRPVPDPGGAGLGRAAVSSRPGCGTPTAQVVQLRRRRRAGPAPRPWWASRAGGPRGGGWWSSQ